MQMVHEHGIGDDRDALGEAAMPQARGVAQGAIGEEK